ncbi:hypothetical protein V6N13_117875 [Hibiscus sabdariffa]|uniref:Uncharacterized protein n=1 Tax=Hibiscus sabdariffa TaxID=183260 RepID=A0ABR2Q9F9_9ROSI
MESAETHSQPDGMGSPYAKVDQENSVDLTDTSLEAISLGCPRLSKFEVLECKKITAKGMWKLTHVLRNTLVDVKISFCKNLSAVSSLQKDST